MKNQPLPVHDMWIDEYENRKTIPVATLPADLLKGLLKCSIVEYEEDKCCRIVTQQIPLELFSLWLQTVYPKKDMLLRPQTPFRNIILHVMLGSDVITMIKDGKPVLLGSGFMDLFNLTRYPNEAPLQKNQGFLSLHINIQPKKVKELVKCFPELAGLKDKRIMKADGKVNKTSLPLNEVTWPIVRDILTCRYIGDAADFYLRRLSVNLLRIFEGMMDKPVHRLSERDREKVEECFNYLKKNYVDQHTVKQMAGMFGISAAVLHKGFQAMFGCTIRQFQLDQRFRLAYHSMMHTKASFGMIADKTGFKSAGSFMNAFRAYYKCDPVLLMRAQ
ncbi:helix-turn-helix transcriptional regulator [Chitinophaga sp. 22620]|uniref:helix-turn-helix transcriptional regulator n=1 Tax=Chitinophaga sp. 22620 TaxID=3453952 RepID=UPI003F87BD07